MLNSHRITAGVSWLEPPLSEQLWHRQMLSCVPQIPHAKPLRPADMPADTRRPAAWPRSHHGNCSADCSPPALPGYGLLAFQSLIGFLCNLWTLNLGLVLSLSSIPPLLFSEGTPPGWFSKFCGPACISRNGHSPSRAAGPNLNPRLLSPLPGWAGLRL